VGFGDAALPGEPGLPGEDAMIGDAAMLGELAVLSAGAGALGEPMLRGAAVAAAVHDAVAPTNRTTARHLHTSRRPRESTLVNI
jgi:hypothetical protein